MVDNVLFNLTFIQLSIPIVANTCHLSSYSYHTGSRQSFSPVKLHYPLAESDPFLQWMRVSRCCFSSQSNYLCHPAFILTSRAFIASLRLIESKISSSSLRKRNLNRGICQTPIFDLKLYSGGVPLINGVHNCVNEVSTRKILFGNDKLNI